MIYNKLKLSKWPIIFSILVLFITLIIGSLIASAIHNEGNFIFTNQIFTGVLILLIIFALGHPKEMFVTSKVRWSKLKYIIVPIAYIIIWPLLQGGYDFSNLTGSLATYMLTVGFAEELMMHSLAMGVMILAWGDTKKSLVRAAVIGSFIFGIVHLMAIPEDPTNFSFVLFKITTVFFAFLISMGFAGLVYQMNTVWVAVILHGIFDMIGGNIGNQEYLTNLMDNWSWTNSIVTILFALPFGIYGYWLLIKDFKNIRA